MRIIRASQDLRARHGLPGMFIHRLTVRCALCRIPQSALWKRAFDLVAMFMKKSPQGALLKDGRDNCCSIVSGFVLFYAVEDEFRTEEMFSASLDYDKGRSRSYVTSI